MIFLTNLYSYSQSVLVHKLTSSLIRQPISSQGQAINRDVLQLTLFAWSAMPLAVTLFPPNTRLPSEIRSLLPPCVLNSSISLFRKMTTGGVKSLSYGRQQEPISLLILGPPRKSMTQVGTSIEPSPVFVLMALGRYLMWTLIPTQLKLRPLP